MPVQKDEKKRSTGELSDGLLKLVFESVSTGILLLNADFTVAMVNTAGAHLVGCDEGKVVGMPVGSVLGDAFEEVDWILPSVLRSGQPRSAVLTFGGLDDQRRLISIDVSLLNSEEQASWLVMSMSDVTENLQNMARSAQTEKMAAVGLLAAGIAHEFNNIWASVQGYAELARQNERFTEPLINVCMEQAERAGEIIHALLSFSDLRVELRKEVRLRPILESIERLVKLELRSKGIHLDFEADCDPVVAGNEGMLQQVFLNLVINACHAIEGKGRIHIRLALEGDSAVVRVRDSGCGISREQMRHLFEPFFTTKGALGGNDRQDGHGLGLALSRNLVALHGGDIAAESEPGRGSVFTVLLPLGADQDSQKTSSGVCGDAVIPAGLRVLFVEDEIVLHGVVNNMLPEQRVTAVVAGEEALEKLKDRDYDVVLLDLILAGTMDGFDVLEWLLSHRPECPVVLLTGRSEHPRLPEYAGKVAGLISKPFSGAELVKGVGAALAGA